MANPFKAYDNTKQYMGQFNWKVELISIYYNNSSEMYFFWVGSLLWYCAHLLVKLSDGLMRCLLVGANDEDSVSVIWSFSYGLGKV